MPIRSHLEALLGQVRALLLQLSDEEYGRSLPGLQGASIGQHLRHVIEFFEELDKGYETGHVNYDRRQRDHRIETDLQVALTRLETVVPTGRTEDKPLLLGFSYDDGPDDSPAVQTTYFRELLYNLEHLVHHMAIIRNSLGHFPQVTVPAGFGQAASTQRNRQACAQ